ncbi:MAG: NlpC/P60 family protein [Maricaulaceae bacterium]
MASSASDKLDPRVRILPKDLPCLETLSVQEAVTGVYQSPSEISKIETQLLFGHRFQVYKRDGEWLWGQAVSPVPNSPFAGYVGWALAKACGAPETAAALEHKIISLKAPVFSQADIKSPIHKILPLGALLSSVEVDGQFVKTSLGFIHKNHIAPIYRHMSGTDFVKIAEAHMGLPYIWGGISTDGLDCSGLVLTSLRAIGDDAPRDADMQEAQLGESVLPDEGLKRGDLIFWPGHVGIMQDEETMIHANAHHMRVQSEPLKEATSRIGSIQKIKRLI